MPQVWRTWILIRISSLTGSSWPKRVRKCQKDWKTIQIQFLSVISSELMPLDCIWSTRLWSELITWIFQKQESKLLSDKSSYHGIMPIDSWSKISRNGKANKMPNLNILKTLTNCMKTLMLLINGFNQPFKSWSKMSERKCQNTNSTMSSQLWSLSWNIWPTGTSD